jgi:nitrite reductase (NADH) large subunit
MQVVIVGNGIAGTLAAKTLRELDPDAGIEVFAAEPYLYYPRPNLIEFIAGRLPFDRLFAFPEKWYGQHRIDVRTGTPVEKIVPDGRHVLVAGGRRVPYDILLLANGAGVAIPPLKGADKAGVFTLRTLGDALGILDRLKDHANVAILGGGLLGLEIARALRSRGAEVEVVEFFDYLLPRQLDPAGGALLRAEIEKTGVRVRLGTATDEILGDAAVRGLRFKDGATMEADLVVLATGVRPNLGLAREAGLRTDRGVIVDEFLETSRPGIFAAGDGVQRADAIYGIIPASFDQARIVAANILGQKKIYEGTVPSNTLKVAGVNLTSVGIVNPQGPGFEEIRLERPEEGIYKKIVLRNDVLVGAIWMGTKNGVNAITRGVTQRISVDKWKRDLLEETFDFSIL